MAVLELVSNLLKQSTTASSSSEEMSTTNTGRAANVSAPRAVNGEAHQSETQPLQVTTVKPSVTSSSVLRGGGAVEKAAHTVAAPSITTFDTVVSQAFEKIYNKLRTTDVQYDPISRQVVVCGDRSAGKSSVLEAISGFNFPVDDDLGTRIPIELVTSKQDEVLVEVAIRPSKARSTNEIRDLESFGKDGVQYTITQFTTSDLGMLAKAAVEKLSHLTKDYNNECFEDALVVKASGPHLPNLTLVDLPGFTHASGMNNLNQDSIMTSDIARSYLSDPHAMILAVVSAKNSLHNQVVTNLVKDIDASGDRTLGVITHPDALERHSNTEGKFWSLAMNKIVNLKLGWHVLRNRNFASRNTTRVDRDRIERDFFLNDSTWRNLEAKACGASALTNRLAKALDERDLSRVTELKTAVNHAIQACSDELASIKDDSVEERRDHLKDGLLRAEEIIATAIDHDPVYGDAFFGLTITNKLRDSVETQKLNFKERMHNYGRGIKIVADERRSSYHNDPVDIGKSAFINKVLAAMTSPTASDVLSHHRLPLVHRMLIQHAKPWERIASEAMTTIVSNIKRFLSAVLAHCFDAGAKAIIDAKILDSSLESLVAKGKELLQEYLEPSKNGELYTLNPHYWVEKIRDSNGSDAFDHLSDLQCDVRKLTYALSKTLEQDKSVRACSQAVDAMRAWYSVLLKVFLDDFGSKCVERSLMRKLPGLLSPDKVTVLSDADVVAAVKEVPGKAAERQLLQVRLSNLQAALNDLHKLEAMQSC